jgi:hypothetical protein
VWSVHSPVSWLPLVADVPLLVSVAILVVMLRRGQPHEPSTRLTWRQRFEGYGRHPRIIMIQVGFLTVAVILWIAYGVTFFV